MKFFLPLFFLTFVNICVAQKTDRTDVVALMQENELVQDLAGLFTVEEQVALSQKLESYKTNTSTPIKVLILPSLNGEEIKVLSLRLAKSWELVDKKRKNGILILLTKEEQKIRIELGKGVLPHISSGDASRILLDAFRPLAKKEKYYAGVDSLTTILIERLDGAFKPDYWPSNTTIALILMFAMFLFIFIRHHSNSTRSKLFESIRQLLIFGFAIGLVVAPWIIGRNYILNNVSEGRFYWTLGLVLLYILVPAIAFFIMILFVRNKSLKKKKGEWKKEKGKTKKETTQLEVLNAAIEEKI